MKKKMILLCILLALVMMTGCAKQEEVIEEIKHQETLIMPLPVTVDINNMSDCMAAISLNNTDAFSDNNEKMQMKVKVWVYDLYDMVDISMLEEGSVIQIREERVEVFSVEVLDKGVLINGGLENGGYELRTDEGTVYYEIGDNDSYVYYELGETVLPVAEDFTFVDSSDLDRGELSYSIEDLQNNEEIIYPFTPDNTKIVVEEGEVVVMERVYVP